MTMICWRCHNKRGSHLPNISDVETWKRRNMIRNNIFLSVIIINYVIIFINFYENSLWVLNFLRNFLIIIESKLRIIHILNEVKTSCEDNIWKCSLNCTFFFFSFSATSLYSFFSASFNRSSFLIWSIYNKDDIDVKSVLEFICLISELVVWHLKSKITCFSNNLFA
jgi:hypothetical protein